MANAPGSVVTVVWAPFASIDALVTVTLVPPIESESTATQPTKSAVLKVIAGLATVRALTSTDVPNTIVPVVWIDGSAGGTLRRS